MSAEKMEEVTLAQLNTVAVEEKQAELLAFLADFHAAYEHSDLTKSPDILKEWLDKLFALRTEQCLIEDALIIAKSTRTYSAKIDNGSRVSLVGGGKKG